jgi:hypothetical protein
VPNSSDVESGRSSDGPASAAGRLALPSPGRGDAPWLDRVPFHQGRHAGLESGSGIVSRNVTTLD